MQSNKLKVGDTVTLNLKKDLKVSEIDLNGISTYLMMEKGKKQGIITEVFDKKHYIRGLYRVKIRVGKSLYISMVVLKKEISLS